MTLTNHSNDDEDQFHEMIHFIEENCPEKDLTILKEDLNVKVGVDNRGMKLLWDNTNWEKRMKMLRDLQIYAPTTKWLYIGPRFPVNAYTK